jgi:flavin reductase (DIM6/NTAB) family NADH-FMN oxidoreductase RutF
MTIAPATDPPCESAVVELRRQVASDEFRRGMRQFASGVTIVATRDGDHRVGLTATAVSSLSVAPPRLLACVNLTGSTYASIARSRRMSVNLLARRHETLARRFAKLDPCEEGGLFELGEWGELATGAPVLHDALAAFDCRVDEMLVAHSHAILIGEVVSIAHGRSAMPLVHMDGSFTGLEHRSKLAAMKP